GGLLEIYRDSAVIDAPRADIGFIGAQRRIERNEHDVAPLVPQGGGEAVGMHATAAVHAPGARGQMDDPHAATLAQSRKPHSAPRDHRPVVPAALGAESIPVFNSLVIWLILIGDGHDVEDLRVLELDVLIDEEQVTMMAADLVPTRARIQQVKGRIEDGLLK